MSEQGWRTYLKADGVADSVVLHGGATAVFRVSSLGAAARLAEAIARLPGVDGSALAVLTAGLTYRLRRNRQRTTGGSNQPLAAEDSGRRP
jgi:4a-hydroxytetrahydrobiopterin dehydratase